jgi:hypothetical protein
MNVHPELPALPAGEPPGKPQPVDVALAALSEMAAELLASGRPSRFVELRNVIAIAQNVQRLRSVAGVDDVEFDGGEDNMLHVPVRARHGRGWNDGADLSREIVMLWQNFLTQFAEVEKRKADRPDPDVRLAEVSELAELYMLRLKLAGADQEVPAEISYRIDHLLKKIGEPTHEPEPGPVVYGPGEPDRGGVGEPLAERAGGDDGAR